MIATAGLQCSYNEPLGSQLLHELASFPYPIIRIDLQMCDQATTTQYAQDVVDAGLQPLCIIRRAEQIMALHPGALIEIGNEPDLEHENWTLEEYSDTVAECIPIALAHGRRLYVGAVSNLNRRGLGFLRHLPWRTYPAEICCSGASVS